MVARILGALAVLTALSVPAQAAPCAVPLGRSVALKSAELDPDVFVWDAKQRVVDYAGGYWRDTSDVLTHTVLAKPGTRAVVVQCTAGVVHQKYSPDTGDAIGIRLTTGPNKGHYGWVTSEDVHQVSDALRSHVASGTIATPHRR
ncbi:MAG TPA: hypothetical protein VHT05_07685 [Candidatus Elarobacter sp.]|nr:hypothetical protein [Candidatus Elarobacter sp.]